MSQEILHLFSTLVRLLWVGDSQVVLNIGILRPVSWDLFRVTIILVGARAQHLLSTLFSGKVEMKKEIQLSITPIC